MNPVFAARWAYKEGEGQGDNPHAKGSREHDRWAQEMMTCQHEELQSIRGELQDELNRAK